MRQFTPLGLHLLGPRLPMGMSLLYLVTQNGYTVRNMPKQEKPTVKLTSEERNKLKMAFVSPQTVKYNPIQLHLPDGPSGSFLFPNAKMAEEHLF